MGFFDMFSVIVRSLYASRGRTEFIYRRCGAIAGLSLLSLYVQSSVQSSLPLNCERNQVIESVIENCVVALFVKEDPRGGFFTDNGWWLNIARRALELVDTCLVNRGVGGGGTTDGKQNLSLRQVEEGLSTDDFQVRTKTLLSPFWPIDSPFDSAVTSGLRRYVLSSSNLSSSGANQSAEMVLVNVTQRFLDHTVEH